MDFKPAETAKYKIYFRLYPINRWLARNKESGKLCILKRQYDIEWGFHRWKE